MGELKAWTELDPRAVGLVILQALHNEERNILGQVEVDLGGRWVLVETMGFRSGVSIRSIPAPRELPDNGKEG